MKNSFNKKQFSLLLISFISGFSVMIVELTAARAVAPVIGSSVYTWTSVIGVILLGLSIGGYVGGYLIDKYKSTRMLSIFLFSAAFFIGLIPFILKNISYFVLADLSILNIILLISITLFFLPAIFLGCLSPTILKLYSEDIENIGKQFGSITALWSLGSIVGTFLTGFYLTGTIGTSNSFFFVSFMLFLLAITILVVSRKSSVKKQILFSFLIFSLVFICFAEEQKINNNNLIFSSESNYYKIAVIDDLFMGEDVRFLFLDFDSHSVENKDSENLNIYTAIHPIFSVFKDDIKDIFVIGGGSYKIAKNFSDFYKGAEIVVSEIDPEVTKVAEDFFNLRDYPIKTINEDVRFTLNNSEKKYDVIYGDAYNSFISVPWYLTTFEFNEVIKKSLKDKGVYLVNFISSLEGENQLFESMLKTFKETFVNFYVIAYGANKEDVQNIVLLGINSDEKISHDELVDRIKKIENGENLWNKVVPQDGLSVSKNALVLTDDFAPIERLMRPLINNYFSDYSKFFYLLF